MLLNKKIAWIILISLFTFDNFISYYAVSKLNGHELNYLIAPIVEKYPLLYFLCIPLSILMMQIFLFIFRKIFSKMFTIYHVEKKSIQTKIILTGFVIYWTIGNSSMNLIYLLGIKKTPIQFWMFLSFFAFIAVIINTFATLKNYQKKQN